MSRIFEALQHAEQERIQRRKSADEQRKLQEGHAAKTRASGTADRHRCLEFASRVAREGVIDFVYHLVGMYPWQCTRCRRCFHRFQR
jgi:hypothetical protein